MRDEHSVAAQPKPNGAGGANFSPSSHSSLACAIPDENQAWRPHVAGYEEGEPDHELADSPVLWSWRIKVNFEFKLGLRDLCASSHTVVTQERHVVDLYHNAFCGV
nr:hypothetical protein CFP56_12910 [Quercus suber]